MNKAAMVDEKENTKKLRQCDSCGIKKKKNEYNNDDPECKKCRHISNSEESYFNNLAYGDNNDGEIT